MQVLEITGYQTAISRSGVNYLQPADAFQNLIDGYIYRQQLQSRLGFAQFATGGQGSEGNLQSRGSKPAETLIEDDNVGNSVNNAEQTFTLNSIPVRRAYVIVDVNDSVHGALQIQITYNGTDGSESFTGDVKTDGTNTIDWDTGAITVTFGDGATTGVTLTGGDPILCTYLQELDVSVTAAASSTQSFTTENSPIKRTTVVVTHPGDSKTITITHAPSVLISEENVGTTAAAAAQTFRVDYIPVGKTTFTIEVEDSLLGSKSIVAEYESGAFTFSGDVDGGGTNTINVNTGAVTVTFDVALTGGDNILVTYSNLDGSSYTGNVDLDGTNTINWDTGAIQLEFDAAIAASLIELDYDYYPSERIMGIFEHILPDNSKETLFVDKSYFYKYVPTTNSFEQVPFTSSDPITDFNITSNDEYVSGTTYPKPDFGERFVFTGKGMADIYFYDGSGIKRFTNTTDNEFYRAPPEGAILKAVHIMWFGERLNLFSPTVNNVLYPQSVFYTGIRGASGNGDKFNAVGGGFLTADTYEFMTGVQRLGDLIIMNFYRSNWSLEKTRDAYNPYFIRKIPSTIGTDSSFGTVSYFNKVESVGKTGIIVTDARESTRTDDKIPYFTRDEIDADDIELTYGGFNRDFSQFLFSYRDTESEIEDTQDKVLVHNYEENTWSTYNERFSCFGQTSLGGELAWDDIYEANNPSWLTWDTTEEIWDEIGIESAMQKTLAGDDYGFVYELSRDFDDYIYPIFGISQASAAVITIPSHAFEVGDRVYFENVEGMTEVNGTIATVTARGANTITVDIISTDFETYTFGGFVSKVITFSAETIPINPLREEGRRCRIAYIDFLIDAAGGNLRVDLLENEEQSPYIENVLLETDSTVKRRQTVRLSVNNEADFHTIRFRQESAINQVVVTNMKIYWEPGGYINA